MNFEEFKKLVQQVDFGKRLPDSIYLHKDAVSELQHELRDFIARIASAVKIPEERWNITKLSRKDFRISYLCYPSFETYPYPALEQSYTVDLKKLTVRSADYSSSENPPILHRRETFLSPTDERYFQYSVFTKQGEEIGLYENTRTIGFRENWSRLIKRKGYTLDDKGHLLPRPLAPTRDTSEKTTEIERHKTALTRDKLSTPLFLLAQRGYLDGKFSVLDYGCGKGDDVRELEAHGVDCLGWDPVYRPDTDPLNSDIVNLGFVINVIEDRQERIETLKRAYELTDKLLLISAMLGNERVYERYTPYKDGVITQRNTFQKYFLQGELQTFIESSLDENAVPIGPGVFIVFKDKLEEQSYLMERQRSRYSWRQLSKPLAKPPTQKRSRELFFAHKVLLEDFWYTCLELGRIPQNDEFDHSEQVRHVCGSHPKAFTICKHNFDKDLFDDARLKKKEDLLTYFALGFFKKRDSYIRMPQSLQREIKTFFGKYTDAREAGKALLFSINNPEIIYHACVEAHDKLPASQLNGQHDFIFHKQFLNQCPLILRVYVGCALQMYGELDEVSLIKAHILSGKVSLMVYDDWSKTVPLLKERIKIKMKEQDIDFFDYFGDYEPAPLENKELFEAK